jgi:hypothetical protein
MAASDEGVEGLVLTVPPHVVDKDGSRLLFRLSEIDAWLGPGRR